MKRLKIYLLLGFLTFALLVPLIPVSVPVARAEGVPKWSFFPSSYYNTYNASGSGGGLYNFWIYSPAYDSENDTYYTDTVSAYTYIYVNTTGVYDKGPSNLNWAHFSGMYLDSNSNVTAVKFGSMDIIPFGYSITLCYGPSPSPSSYDTFTNTIVITLDDIQVGSGLIAFTPVVDLSFISLDCETDILRLSVATNGAVSALYPSDVDGQGVSGVYDDLTGFFDVFLPSGLSSGLHNLYYYGALEHEGEFFAFDGVYSFNYTCEGSPPPEESPPEAGQFKIVYPVSKQVFDNGTGSIVVQVQYGGDASVDFPGYDVKLKLENLAGTEWSSYLVSPVVSDGITTWSVSMPINDDNSYTLNAYLQSSDTWLASVVRFDFVFFEVGGGSIPEDVVGFLQRWWEMFKEWFVGVMNYLFVPTAQQINSLLPSSASSDYGFNPFTPEMFPSPVYAVDIPLSATHSISLSVEGVPDLYVTIMRAFSQVFISLSLIFFILKGF